ncbi:MAG: lipid biosynthesis B12-binding/radical SAM protein [Desulfopila sp.]|jgi:radical SAM superfamily enzyme YgiQ (UPF0313 family)|nr:lipid biosynthesis B12-binding/radical SAM protein [Desulfopila sp.]
MSVNERKRIHKETMTTPVSTTHKAHCLLISANLVKSPYPVYPIGVAYIMGALHECGHKADHCDILASQGYSELDTLLADNRYDIIGISIRNIDSASSTSTRVMVEDILEVIHHIRSRCTIPIVLGGPGFSIMPEKLMRYLGADYGIIGEGEIAFPQLIDKILRKERLSERLFSHHLAAYPDCRPLFTAGNTRYYVDHGGMLSVQTKRGCNYGCAYCSYPAIEGKRLRCRDPKEVVENIRELVQDYKARYIFFSDGVFNDPRDHYLQVAEALIKAGNTTPWCAFFRPQNLGKKEIQLMKRSGMAAMELGTDASSDTTLAGLNKGFSFAEVVAANEAITREGVPCAHFILFGGPGETEETVHKGLANIARLDNCVVFTSIGLRILPGTKLYNLALAEELITPQTDIITPVYYYSPLVDKSYIDRELRRAFQEKIDRIYPMEEMDQHVQLLHSLGRSGPLWDLILKR